MRREVFRGIAYQLCKRYESDCGNYEQDNVIGMRKFQRNGYRHKYEQKEYRR
jgi:hypothetical protein